MKSAYVILFVLKTNILSVSKSIGDLEAFRFDLVLFGKEIIL